MMPKHCSRCDAPAKGGGAWCAACHKIVKQELADRFPKHEVTAEDEPVPEHAGSGYCARDQVVRGRKRRDPGQAYKMGHTSGG